MYVSPLYLIMLKCAKLYEANFDEFNCILYNIYTIIKVAQEYP